MQRREFMELLAAAGTGLMMADNVFGEGPAAAADKKLIGMYVHECWVYNRPYAARSWTDDDWRGYLDGLSRLGFNSDLDLAATGNRAQPHDRER